MPAEIDYPKILDSISRDIEQLKKEFSQLREFSSIKNTNRKNLSITYGYHTHQALDRVGWVGAVPNPDADGIWFYIDFHAPDSMAQIHTQPVVPRLCLGSQVVSLMMLEGKETKSVRSSISTILERHGVTACERK